MQSIFNGEETQDKIQIEFGEVEDRCLIRIVQVDDVAAQIALIQNIVSRLEERGYDFIGLWSKHKFFLPEESTCYRDMDCRVGNLVYCDTKHFEEFFKKNLQILVNYKNLYVDPNPKTADGWTKVTNKKLDRKMKYKRIKEEIKILCSDWGSFE